MILNIIFIHVFWRHKKISLLPLSRAPFPNMNNQPTIRIMQITCLGHLGQKSANVGSNPLRQESQQKININCIYFHAVALISEKRYIYQHVGTCQGHLK